MGSCRDLLTTTPLSVPSGSEGEDQYGKPSDEGEHSGEWEEGTKASRRKGKKKKDEINLVTIKPLTVLTVNPQILKHTEGVLGIKAFN